MDKEHVDKIIIDYKKKIYGFALSKTIDIDTAEEIAARITYEVYISLLKAEKIHNVNSYIFRIASNVYSRYVNEELSINQISNIDFNHYEQPDLSRETDYARIREEIGYLSKLQREIVVMHYYKKMKVNDIATKLNTYPGKVKWHLFEARNQIKDGFQRNKKKDEEAKHIKFSRMRQFGHSSPNNITMSFYFSKNLSQRIAYCAYHTAKTTIEIAKELEVAVVFVEDEINHLVQNGFMEKLTGNRYLTNILITETIDQRDKMTDEIMGKYIERITDLYIPQLLKTMSTTPAQKIYTPENDKNFLLWSIVTYACKHKLALVDNKKELFKMTVKRKDGGDYISAALVEDINQKVESIIPIDKNENKKKKTYQEYGDLYSFNSKDQMRVWEFFSQFDDINRKPNLQLETLFQTFYDFLTGNLIIDNSNIEKYINLFEKGYLVSNVSEIYFNMVITTMSENEFADFLPPIPNELKILGKELDEEMFKINQPYYPPQMQKLCRLITLNALSSGQTRVRVLDYLLKKGILKPLKKHQKKTANMIMFTDILPHP